MTGTYRRLIPIVTLIGMFGLCADAQADQVRISNLRTVGGNSWVIGDPSIELNELVCIYREDSSGTARDYVITAIGDGPGFFLASGANKLAYTITWNDGGTGNPTGGATSTIVHNVAFHGLNNARNNSDVPTNSDDCMAGSAPTAQLNITISNSSLEAAPAGTYNGNVMLVLSSM